MCAEGTAKTLRYQSSSGLMSCWLPGEVAGDFRLRAAPHVLPDPRDRTHVQGAQ